MTLSHSTPTIFFCYRCLVGFHFSTSIFFSAYLTAGSYLPNISVLHDSRIPWLLCHVSRLNTVIFAFYASYIRFIASSAWGLNTFLSGEEILWASFTNNLNQDKTSSHGRLRLFQNRIRSTVLIPLKLMICSKIA